MKFDLTGGRKEGSNGLGREQKGRNKHPPIATKDLTLASKTLASKSSIKNQPIELPFPGRKDPEEVTMVANTLRYAVTVSREDGEFLFFDIRRKPGDGDVYINYPRLFGGPKAWNPHTSMHGSGALHHRDFNRKFIPRQTSKPDVSFAGSQNLNGLAMRPEQWRNIKKAFAPQPFAGKFQIDVERLLLDTRRTQFQVDLIEPKGRPELIAGRVLQQDFFTDVAPWIVLTLIDVA